MEKKKITEELKIQKKSFINKLENVGETYTLDPKLIGSGNYGVVRKAVHKLSQQERAIKIIPKSKIRDLARFKGEVDILRTVVLLSVLSQILKAVGSSKRCETV